MNRPPLFTKDSDFKHWRIVFADFIASQENGAEMITSFTEGPMIKPYNKLEKDYTENEIRRMKADKDASSWLLLALPSHIRIDYLKHNPMFMWNALSRHLHGSEVPFLEKKEEKKIIKLEDEPKPSMSDTDTEDLKDKIIQLKKNLSDMETQLEKEREDFRKERADHLNEKKKFKTQIQHLSLKVSELTTISSASKQVSCIH